MKLRKICPPLVEVPMNIKIRVALAFVLPFTFMLVLTGIAHAQLPSGVATKAWVLPVILVFFGTFMSAFSRKEDGNREAMLQILTGISWLFLTLQIDTLQKSWSAIPNLPWLWVGFSFLSLKMGRCFLIVKQNPYIGIRLPSTMKSAIVWNKVHQRAGWFLLYSGWISLGLVAVIHALRD
jgi:uncharacterized membrane protein